MKRIAVAGNPNAGKTCIFNALTGTVQHVSNYPGVTVERKEGTAVLGARRFTVVDLPGTYSLTAYSIEEIVARRFILEESPDLIIDVVDASNLERNLYLTTQLMEMGVPMIVVLNMVDIARGRGVTVDAERLSALLGVPVVETVGNRGRGVRDLHEVCADVLEGKRGALPKLVTYGHEVGAEVDAVAQCAAAYPALAERFPPRWLAVKCIEEDEDVIRRARAVCAEGADAVREAAQRSERRIGEHFNEDAPAIIAERRYGFAAGVVRQCTVLSAEARQNATDLIDAFLCNRAFGPVFLVGIVTLLFFAVFRISEEWRWIPWFGGWTSPQGVFEQCFEALSNFAAGLEASMPMLHSLIDDGLIGGVGGVMGFVPLIFVLFFFISILEDSGYIARVAFLLDRVLQTFGMQGKSILAMIVSGGLGAGGCAVPGVLATRTLREPKDRLVTMLVVPFMNCGAKMPVYAMLIAAFFSERRTAMMLLLWAISWVVALCAAWVLRRTVLRGDQTPFVMELPPYHVPMLRAVLRHTWERTWMYIKKAGTIILAVNVVMWALMYFPQMPDEQAAQATEAEQLAYSAAGRIGRAVEPLSAAAGFDWRTNVALVGGFAAKELVVGTLGTVYSMGEATAEEYESLSARLAGDPHWTPLHAFVMMLFVMLYAPCFVTVAVIARESGHWKWALFSTAFSTSIAFALAVLVFQLGRLVGLGV